MLYKTVGVLKGVLKNFANFTGSCERKSLALCVQYVSLL